MHCFNGKPLFIQVITERNLERHTAFEKVYDFDWNETGWSTETYPDIAHSFPKPNELSEIKEIAQKLSKDFKYVRVDFYIVDGKILFGEMTFTPGSGLYKYQGKWTSEIDLMLGNLIDLDSNTLDVS